MCGQEAILKSCKMMKYPKLLNGDTNLELKTMLGIERISINRRFSIKEQDYQQLMNKSKRKGNKLASDKRISECVIKKEKEKMIIILDGMME